MGNFNTVFKDFIIPDSLTSTVEFDAKNNVIDIFVFDNGNSISCFTMDKSTAIKFAKTLRTEINKITESEVDNER